LKGAVGGQGTGLGYEGHAVWDVHVVAVARRRGRCGIARGLVVGGVWRGYYRIEPCFDATATAATINGLPQKLFFLHLYSDENQLFWSLKRLEREWKSCCWKGRDQEND